MNPSRDSWLIPGAILLAGALLAITTYMVRSSHVLGAPEGSPSAMRPVHPSEHIVGNPQAKVTIVEYADIDSQYAKEFQQTLSQLMAEYGDTGEVAWVYRHFPLVDQHRYAVQHAEAAECVASLSGEGAFWRFIDLLQANAPGLSESNPDAYPAAIAQLGVNESSFNECIESGRFEERIEEDFRNALASGATASPYSILLIEGQAPAPINGSVPYATLKQIVDAALGEQR